MERERYDFIFQYERSHWWYRGRQILLKNILKNIALKKTDRLLDYGCGTGATLMLLNEYGKSSGADIDRYALNYCLRRGLSRLHKIRGKKLPFSKNQFQLITCLDVLEHIPDDAFTLKEFHRILKPGGTLILFVPAFASLWSELDAHSHHHRRYTKIELLQKIKTAEFNIEETYYFNYLFFLPIFVIRQLQKLKIVNSLKDWGVHPIVKSQLLNRLLYMIFLIDIKTAALLNSPFGVSIAAVATK
jgi:ubiquinone/menaquinone biosynthesis C-methylase UbiE